MTPASRSRLATALWLFGDVVFVASSVLGVVDHHGYNWTLASQVVAFVSIGVVGWILARRRPENPIGWIYLGVWVGVAIVFAFLEEYATWAFNHDGPFVDVATWMTNWAWVPILGALLSFPFLLFPDGRLLSRRWRPVAWALGIVLALWSMSFAFETQDYVDAAGRHVPNPFTPEGLGPFFNMAKLLLAAASLALVALSLASLFIRFRRATGDERQQVKWLLYSGTLLVAWLIVPFEHGNETWVDQIQGLLIALIPVSIGIAILKYRLYEIDVVIRKTVVFAALAAFIALVYAGIVGGVGALVGEASNTTLAFVAAAVLAVAFQPARDAARRFADRLVYGKRATPYEVLSEFSGRMRETYATEDVLPRMAQILGEGTAAAAATVWLRVGGVLRPAGSWPVERGLAPVAIAGDGLPDLGEPAVAVVDAGELLGALSTTFPPSDPMSPAKERLVKDLASQAGLVLRNVRLIEELRASRQRLVAAQDDERRKLERDLHDGAQQQLVALQVQLRLTTQVTERDPAKALPMIRALQGQAGAALEDLRDLARGIYPPLLADQGLAAALESQTRKASLPVQVDPDGVGRYDRGVESAVYFCTLEALNNVAKYAKASSATVRLTQSNGTLRFEVVDDGAGFDAGATTYGTGLQGMADRLDAVGGTLEVRSAPGEGTTVIGHVPVSAA